MTVAFRSAKARNFRGAKGDYATVIFRPMLTVPEDVSAVDTSKIERSTLSTRYDRQSLELFQ